MSHRPLQIASLLHHAMSEIIRREVPLEQFGLITITEVKVTPGLDYAKIFFGTLHAKKAEEIETMLNTRSHYFIKLLKKKVLMRRIPEITFVYDPSGEKMDRIDRLIQEGLQNH